MSIVELKPNSSEIPFVRDPEQAYTIPARYYLDKNGHKNTIKEKNKAADMLYIIEFGDETQKLIFAKDYGQTYEEYKEELRKLSE